MGWSNRCMSMDAFFFQGEQVNREEDGQAAEEQESGGVLMAVVLYF